jgi:hypothetical protein
MLSISLACLAFGTTAFAGEKETAAEAAARDWLSYVDAGEYVTSWSNAGALFKKQVTPQAWDDAASNARKPLGALRSRGLQTAQHSTSLPGVGDGEYVLLQFATSFENKAAGVETVATVFEDGVWRVIGYFIR